METYTFEPDKELLDFADWFSERYKLLPTAITTETSGGDYFSDNKKYHIKYVDKIIDIMGNEPKTDARISHNTKVIEVSKSFLDELEAKIKSMEGAASKQAENYKTIEDALANCKKEVETLSAYKGKEAELNQKEASLKEKEFQLTTKEQFASDLEAERKESKKQFFDVVTTVLGSQIKTEKISKLFSEIPVFDSNGGSTIKKIGEESEKKSS